MSITIGHASIDENNKIQGGNAGDQTGKEVCTRSYYVHSKGWYLLRPKSVDVADTIAKAMLEACNNNNIGYDQSSRTGVITKLRSYKTLGKIGVKTECDCSSLVRACCIQAGFDPGDFTTYNEADVLEKSGYFEKRVAVTTNTEVKNGDVLVTKTKGHTVIVVSGNPRKSTNDPKSTASSNDKLESAMYKASGYSKGKSFKTTSDLNMRTGAGTSKKSLKVLSKGAVVTWYGYYNTVNGTDWYLVVDKKGANGYVSSKYLKA